MCYPRWVLRPALFCVVAMVLPACAGEEAAPTDGAVVVDGGPLDSGAADSGQMDAAAEPDAGFADALVVDAGPPPDTWDNFAATFFATYCNGCHDGVGVPSTDYSDYDQVFANRDLIRCGVAPSTDPSPNCQSSPFPAGQFPVGLGPKPSREERLRLVDWIDQGALRN